MWLQITKKVIGQYFGLFLIWICFYNPCQRNYYQPKYWPITFFAICDHIKITCSKSDLRSDQDHDLEFSQKVIGDKIAILDHFLSRSLWIFLPQFSEHRFRFNIVMWVPFPNNWSFFCIIHITIFDLSLLIKDSNFYWLCQALYLESDYRLCLKKHEFFRKSDLKKWS